MILEGNSRGGARNLADHLMSQENDHVTLHELRGFSSDTLHGALNETYAISRATKCKQFLYSLSFNPPPKEHVSTADFEVAIESAEQKLGLNGHPRAIVFHEKEGRRHCHVVWNRVDQTTMTARNMSFDREKLQDVSRELYHSHGWKMPKGFADRSKRDPRNFTLDQWQEARRADKDPRETIDALRDSWSISDSRVSFSHALNERGYYLARGDRRGFVAIDMGGSVHSISRKAKIKTRELQDRLGDPVDLLSVEEATEAMAQDMSRMIARLYNEQATAARVNREHFEKEKQKLIAMQREERTRFDSQQQARQQLEQRQRQERFRKGFGGLWDRVTGKHRRLAEQNRLEAEASNTRQREARDKLIFEQLGKRRLLQTKAQARLDHIKDKARSLRRDRELYRPMLTKSPIPRSPERSQPAQKPQPPPSITVAKRRETKTVPRKRGNLPFRSRDNGPSFDP